MCVCVYFNFFFFGLKIVYIIVVFIYLMIGSQNSWKWLDFKWKCVKILHQKVIIISLVFFVWVILMIKSVLTWAIAIAIVDILLLFHFFMLMHRNHIEDEIIKWFIQPIVCPNWARLIIIDGIFFSSPDGHMPKMLLYATARLILNRIKTTISIPSEKKMSTFTEWMRISSTSYHVCFSRMMSFDYSVATLVCIS